MIIKKDKIQIQVIKQKMKIIVKIFKWNKVSQWEEVIMKAQLEEDVQEKDYLILFLKRDEIVEI